MFYYIVKVNFYLSSFSDRSLYKISSSKIDCLFEIDDIITIRIDIAPVIKKNTPNNNAP